jgi:hypothetical protein
MKTTTEEVAARYYELAQRGQIDVIKRELYAEGIVSIEPENNSQLPLVTEGMEAYEKKEQQFYQMYNEINGGFCLKPLVTTCHFTCAMGMDVTLNGQRKMKEEIGVFEVKNGKIVKEQFFYNDFI